MKTIFKNATVIDGTGRGARCGEDILVDGGRFERFLTPGDPRSAQAEVVDLTGKYVIPGLMNANVHLFMDFRLQTLARYFGEYEGIIEEAAQVALKNGVTTVFDTWGPRRYLMSVRDRINAEQVIGSRIFCAGNIIGFDGPLSNDFGAKSAEIAGAAFAKKINSIWVENVGRHLMWLTPEQVAEQVGSYFESGIDFAKYASNGHGGAFGSAFLALSPDVQSVIVREAHRKGLTVQAHSMTVEGLKMALNAGCDLVTHCNITGPVTIPDTTLDMFLSSNTGAVIFPFTEDRLRLITDHGSDADRTLWEASDRNARNLIERGARLLAATDGGIWPADMDSEPLMANRVHLRSGDDNLFDLAKGHFAWFRAMEEKGCDPMVMLQAATRNIAEAYGKEKDLGTIEAGKIADMVVLDRNPLENASNYSSIHMVIKDGKRVDIGSLPLSPILTKPDHHHDEEDTYIPFLSSDAQFPLCPLCPC